MSKLVIKGAFHDEISRILHHNETETPHYMFTTTVEADNGSSKEYMAKMFAECISYDIQGFSDDYGECDTSIEFTVKRPQADIDKFHEERKQSLKYCISRLKKWCDHKEADKEQILTYLKAKDLNWIAEQM